MQRQCDAIFEENIKENTENKNIENTTNATNATTAIVEYKEKENFFIKILTGLRNMLIKVLSQL